MGQGLVPEKYPHRRVTLIASLKRNLKIAQFRPSCSRRGMLAGSFSMEVGDASDVEAAGVVIADMAGVGIRGGLGDGPGVEAREVEADGNEELAGELVVAFWAGPITCSKSLDRG